MPGLVLSINANNAASPHLKAVGADIDALTAKAHALNRAFQSSGAPQAIQQLGQSFHALAGIAGSILNTLGGLLKNLAGAVLDVAGKIAGELVSAFHAVAGAAARAGLIVGGVLAAALLAVGKSGVDMNVTLESSTLALEKITGSSQLAAKMISALQQEALTSKLEFKEMLPLGTQLAAVYGPEGLGKVIPTMRAFGDAAALLAGGDKGAASRALLQFRQLASRERPDERDLLEIEQNLPGAGRFIKPALVKAFGSADPETLRSAHVTGMQVAETVVAALQQGFGGAQERLAHTLPVLLSNFGDAFNKLAAAVTAKFTPALTTAIDKVYTLFEGLANNKSLVAALAVPFDLLGVAINAAADALPALVQWLERTVTADNVIKLISDVVGWFQALGDEVMRFLGIVSGGKTLGDVFEVFKTMAVAALDIVAKAWGAFMGGVQYLAEHGGELWGMMVDAMKPLQDAFETLIGAVVVLFALFAADKIASLVKNLLPLVILLAALGGGGGGTSTQAGMGLPGGFDFNIPNFTTPGKDWKPGDPIPGAPGVPGTGGRVGRSAGAGEPAMPQGSGLLPGGGFNIPGVGQISTIGDLMGKLHGLGHGAIGELTKGVQAGIGAIPGRVKNFGKGFADAVKEGWEKGGIAGIAARAAAHSGNIGDALRGLLGGGAGGPDPNAIPRTNLYGQAGGGSSVTTLDAMGNVVGRTSSGGAAGAAAGGATSEADLKKIVEIRNAAFSALEEQAKVLADAGPPAQRAAMEAARVVPILVAQQQDLIEQAKRFNPSQKEYWELAKDFWRLQGQGQSLQSAAVREQADSAKKAGEEARGQVDLLRAVIKNVGMFDPASAARMTREQVTPALLQELRGTVQPVAGETQADRFRRLTEAERLKGEIMESSGLLPHGRPAFAHTLGGGSMALFDQKKVSGLLGEINAAGMETPGAAAPRGPLVNMPVNIMAGVDLRDPRIREQIHREIDLRLDQLQRGTDLSPSPTF